MRRALPPLVVVATLTAIFISRTGLVLHELLGHGGATLALGGRVTGYHLFLFGGGRVQHAFDARVSVGAALLLALGGIAVELVVGAAVLVAAARVSWTKQRPLARFVATALGAAFVMHGVFYLVEGTHYGYGDGRIVHVLLGDAARPWFVGVGTCVLTALAFAAGATFARFVQGWLGPHSRGRRVAVFVAMFAVAGGVHLALTKAEAAVVSDPTYARLFRDEATERAYRELTLRLRERAARGDAAPSDAEQRRMLEELAAKDRPFPLRPLLIVLLTASGMFGLLRRREPPPPDACVPTPTPTPLDWRSARTMAIAATAALGVVLLLDAARSLV